jgi:hypothetical protein
VLELLSHRSQNRPNIGKTTFSVTPRRRRYSPRIHHSLYANDGVLNADLGLGRYSFIFYSNISTYQCETARLVHWNCYVG